MLNGLYSCCVTVEWGGGGLADSSQWTLYYTYMALDQVPEATGEIFYFSNF